MNRISGLLLVVIYFFLTINNGETFTIFNSKRQYASTSVVQTYHYVAVSQDTNESSNYKTNVDRSDVKADFIKQITPIAIEIQEKYNIPASVTIAMAAIESNYGRSTLSKEANNYFGIKADISWNGDIYKAYTHDLDVYHVQKFRSYDSMEESFEDYALFLTQHPRYANAFNYTNNPVKFCKRVLNSGYCPTPDYLENVIYVRDNYSLAQYDQN